MPTREELEHKNYLLQLYRLEHNGSVGLPHTSLVFKSFQSLRELKRSSMISATHMPALAAHGPEQQLATRLNKCLGSYLKNATFPGTWRKQGDPSLVPAVLATIPGTPIGQAEVIRGLNIIRQRNTSLATAQSSISPSCQFSIHTVNDCSFPSLASLART